MQPWIKFFHLLLMITWIGNSLSLSRFLGYQKKLKKESRSENAPLFLRMWYFVSFPTLLGTLLTGGYLLYLAPEKLKYPYFHVKLLLVLFLLAVDLYLLKVLKCFIKTSEVSPLKARIIHGCQGLFLIVILWSIYVYKLKFI